MDKENKNQTALDVESSKSYFGFWVYILTDCVLFASLFATYAVLHMNTFGGPSADQLFDPNFVLLETLFLLTSSFTAGLGIISAYKQDKKLVLAFFMLTFLLGASFVGLELSEFAKFISRGNGFTRSGFLSSYFTLVGTHGLHVTAGLLWMGILLIRIRRLGLTPKNVKRLTLLTLFWHFLDIIWIFIFTIVYMLGMVMG